MPWTFDEISRDWLAGAPLAVSPDVIVEAFNRVEDTLGPEWIQSVRPPSCSGTAPTLRVVTMGRKLAFVDGVAGGEKLVARLRQEDESAEAELSAIYLLRPRRTTVIELYPKIVIGNAERVPYFRIRQPGEAWTYVEVPQPDISQAQERVIAILHRLAGIVKSGKKSFALEVFLRREPSAVEVELLAGRVLEVCLSEGVLREDLPDGLGLLLLNRSQPGEIVLEDHSGEEKHPRRCVATAIAGGDEAHRHIAVRMAFADERAEQFLTKEARQLPPDAPGLIMVGMARAPGGFQSWEPLVRRRFQPKLHTRVSAVCLFSGGLVPTKEGEAWPPRTKLLVNPHAKLSLPSWIPEALEELGV